MGLFDFMKPKSELELMFEEAKKSQSQNKTDALYQFEHLNFKQLFFDHGQNFANSLASDKDFVYFVYSKQCELMHQTPKYKKEQFILTAHSNDKNQIVFKLVPPEPYRAPLCYVIYMVVDLNGQPISYKTMEKSIATSNAVMCGWGKDGSHYNYGERELDKVDRNMILYNLDLAQSKSFNDLIEQLKNLTSIDSTTEASANINDNQTNEKEIPAKEEMIQMVDEFPKQEQVLYCKNCGAKLDKDEKFCHQCGRKAEQ